MNDFSNKSVSVSRACASIHVSGDSEDETETREIALNHMEDLRGHQGPPEGMGPDKVLEMLCYRS